MAIQTVKVTINGTEHTLEYNSTTGKWEKSITAPTTTSYNLTGGYYPVSVTATNQAGTSSTITDADMERLAKASTTLSATSSVEAILSELNRIAINISGSPLWSINSNTTIDDLSWLPDWTIIEDDAWKQYEMKNWVPVEIKTSNWSSKLANAVVKVWTWIIKKLLK